jgi:hypothetical protein
MKNSMILDRDIPVVLGNCIRVENVEKSNGVAPSNDEDVLVCMQVESENGKDEYCILFTLDEFDRIPRLEGMDERQMIAGRIYMKFIGYKNYYLVKMKGYDGIGFVGMFDIGFWADCFKRAITHPNSCTKKGFITDILD